ALEQTAARVREAGGQAQGLRCDVSRADDVEQLAAAADRAHGGADLVVNNAGVTAAGAVGTVPLADWRWQLDVNLWGVIHGCHAFVPRLRAQGCGWILNVASTAGLVAGPGMGPYNVAKAGVVALTDTLHAELHGTGVGVSALCPTFFRTNIHATARFSDDAAYEQAKRLVTEARWSAEQIADRALRGVEQGELYIIPQADGRALWQAKRLLGPRFHGRVGQALVPRLVRWLSGR
ncbi:MAG: SDR family NAD(P)-dependent oxidoreductase, partial [Myxococcales bacterium]|nr:SDR family NAD(P)-dependent oxidoreductase [Myxococcales bacterium]